MQFKTVKLQNFSLVCSMIYLTLYIDTQLAYLLISIPYQNKKTTQNVVCIQCCKLVKNMENTWTAEDKGQK